MKESFSQNIVEEIEKRDLKPRPRFYFLLKRSVFWSLASLSAVIGGIAVSIIIFVFFDHDPEAARYLHQSLTEDIMLSVPYLWLLILAAFVGVAKYSVRHTKTGYRYATLKIVGAVLIASLALGLLLDAFDSGAAIDDYLSDTLPYYSSLVYTSKDAWTNPDKGLLGGEVLEMKSPTEFSLRDFKNRMWQISIDPNELDETAKNIKAGDLIKIIGIKVSNANFQAKQIFSWGN